MEKQKRLELRAEFIQNLFSLSLDSIDFYTEIGMKNFFRKMLYTKYKNRDMIENWLKRGVDGDREERKV